MTRAGPGASLVAVRGGEQVFDAVVVGGGPAGSSAAIALRRAGRSVAVLEREPFPRFHIGESLLPASTRLFDHLGLGAELSAAGFVEKWGATFHDAAGEHAVSYDFAEWTARPTVAMHVPRDRFDQLLLEHAAHAGAEVRTAGARQFREEGREIVVTTTAGELRARYLIDASGRAGFVARALGERVPDRRLDKAAVYAHLRGVPRPAGRRGGDVQIVSAPDLGWVWLIPLPGGITSIGAVLDTEVWRGLGRGELDALFERALKGFPLVRGWLAGADRVAPVRVESSFAYGTKRYAGGRWLLAGDAGSFLDPVFSTGVHLAVQGGAEAAAAVDRALATGAPTRPLRRYARLQMRRYRFLRRFVLSFYRCGTRDLFFAPTRRFGLTPAVTALLAGDFDPGPLNRLRLLLFFAIGRVQSRVALVPRLHPPRLSARAGSD
jgi:flavin-dependent dehydrogenase